LNGQTWINVLNAPNSKLAYLQFDVGQGDAVLIKQWGNVTMVDAGISTKGEEIKNILLKLGIKEVDQAFISHNHQDHMGGYADMPEMLVNTQFFVKDPSMYSALQLTQSVSIGKITVEPINYSSMTEVNNASLVTYLQVYGTEILLTGDIEAPVEDLIYEQLRDVDVVKVPHHGSNTSSTQAFVRATLPEYAVISVGRNNYGHPSSMVMKRYESMGTQLMQTSDGCVKVTLLPFGIYFISQLD